MKWKCKKCGEETDVSVFPGHRGQISGPPDRCYPPEAPEVEPDFCKCGAEIDAEAAAIQWMKERPAESDYPEDLP